MKRVLIISGIVAALIALFIFNKLTSRSVVSNTFTEVKKGSFEITVTNSGELIAEKSLDIRGPEMGQAENQQQNQQQGQQQQPRQQGSGGQGGGMQGGGMQGGGMQGGGGGQARGGGGQPGSDMRAQDLKILDMVPEGTVVKKGDYIAQLDKSSFDNSLRDELTNLTTLQTTLEMKILDTAVTLTALRDEIKNQDYTVEEAATTLAQSQFESPATIRQAEINLDRQKRTLEQKKKSYSLSLVRTETELLRQKVNLARRTRLATDLQDYLAKFTITAPSDGMVIYKKERNGAKRKAGSSLNAFDLVIATLPDLTSMISKTYVNEIEVSKVKPGQKVSIEIDAFPDKSYTGSVISVANIGEVLPNSDSKMFEVQIRIDGSDPALRPTMTTGNKIIIETYDNVTYIPTECVQTGSDTVPFVYEKRGSKQIVMLGKSNEKNVIVEQGLDPGTIVYLTTPEEPEKFKIDGEELIPLIKARK